MNKRDLVALMAAVIYAGKMGVMAKSQFISEDESALMRDSIREAATINSMLMEESEVGPEVVDW